MRKQPLATVPPRRHRYGSPQTARIFSVGQRGANSLSSGDALAAISGKAHRILRHRFRHEGTPEVFVVSITTGGQHDASSRSDRELFVIDSNSSASHAARTA